MKTQNMIQELEYLLKLCEKNEADIKELKEEIEKMKKKKGLTKQA